MIFIPPKVAIFFTKRLPVVNQFEKLQSTLDVEWGKKILRSQAENIWSIGCVGLVPISILVRTNLRNIPEKGMLTGGGLWTGYVHPEQFFFKQK